MVLGSGCAIALNYVFLDIDFCKKNYSIQKLVIFANTAYLTALIVLSMNLVSIAEHSNNKLTGEHFAYLIPAVVMSVALVRLLMRSSFSAMELEASRSDEKKIEALLEN